MAKANSFYSEYQRGKDGVRLGKDWLIEFEHNLQRVEGSVVASIAKTIPSITNNLKSLFTAEIIRDNAAFEPSLVRALQEGKIIDLNDAGKVHAELRIIDRLLRDKKIQEGENFYISTSKKCCANCEATIKAVNHVFRREDGTVQSNYGEHPSLLTNQPLTTRDLLTEGHGHGVRYGSSDVPRFMTEASKSLSTIQKTNVITKFLEITGASNLRNLFAEKVQRTAKYLGPIKCRSQDLI